MAVIVLALVVLAVVGGAFAVAGASGHDDAGRGGSPAGAASDADRASPSALPSSALTGTATRSAPTVAQPPIATVLNGGPLVHVVGEVSGSGGLAASCAENSAGGVQVSALRKPLGGAPTTVDVTWKLPPGTYTAWTCVHRQNRWSRVSPTVAFTVTGGGGPDAGPGGSASPLP